MARIEVKNRKTGALEEIEGTDRRFDTSSRSDTRGYYNSRDDGQSYSATWFHSASADGQYSFFLKNNSSTLTLVVSSVGINAFLTARFKLWFATGGTNGVAVTPVNLNKASPHAADATFLNDAGTTVDTVTVAGSAIDDLSVVATGHEEMRLGDRVRLGQNDGIALEMDTGDTTPLVHGVVFFYFE